ncbi:aminotransferase class V-fold PLP-dependent enzyme [Tetragenococcus solitarius]|uniref:Aminotransferase class V-fold PLP-dependent enzyme n=1 Tax=Tetragenococcus solitarius TaxID=71453 RepID=A0ABP6KRX5_9ENTE|nr:aminotransferase class V-fold PLP-dependent enzyme [Tetragenococcus solitarius]
MHPDLIDQFPTLKKLNYLGSCSQGLLPKQTSNALDRYHEELLTYGSNWELATQKVEEARNTFAKLINAEPDEIAIVSSVSHAISAIATSLPVSPTKDEIIFTDFDFPTVEDVWTSQARFKHKIHKITSEKNHIALEKFEKEISEKTLLTSIPHVHYKSGFKFDIDKISKIAHKKGSLIFVDAYQSAGHCPIDVKEMNIDFLATGTRKYLLGIPGISFLYIKKEIADRLNPYITGWLGQGKKGARKFDTGTPSFISAYAAVASIQLIQSIGVDTISTYLDSLGKFALEYGTEKGLTVYGSKQLLDRTSLIAFFHSEAKQVVHKLKKNGIVLTSKENIIRISPHFYNSNEDIKKAIDGIINYSSKK